MEEMLRQTRILTERHRICELSLMNLTIEYFCEDSHLTIYINEIYIRTSHIQCLMHRQMIQIPDC